MRLRVPGLVLATSLLFHISAGAPAAPPVEAFATLPQFSDVRISPGGRFIAAKAYVGGEYILLTYDLDNPGPPKTITPGGMQLSWIHWKSDERLLASLWFPSRRWTVATIESRLFGLAPDGSKMKMLAAPRERDALPVQLGNLCAGNEAGVS